jgi:prevent-host-death family protein
MKTTSVTNAKNQLSALLDRVRAGESVLILDRGVAVARLEPVGAQDDPDGRLARLERSGVLRRGNAAPPVDLIGQAPPRPAPGPSVVDALIEERRSGL